MVSVSDESKVSADVSGGEARSPPSDTDERPVRKQLKETSIDTSNNTAPSGDSGSGASVPEQNSGRKRSFEEARGEPDDVIENGDGPRKRSRECTPEGAKKQNSAEVPAPDNVSQPIPKDPMTASPRNLATVESSPGILGGCEAEYNVITDFELENPLLPVESAPLGAPQEIEEIPSGAGSESEIEILEVPDALEIISTSDSESESEEETQVSTSARIRERSFDSVELKWLEYFRYTRENTPELKVLGVPTDCPTCFLVEAPSCGQEPQRYYFENDNTNTPLQNPKEHTTADAMNDDDPKALKKKRSLEQLEEEGAKKAEETEKKRHRDNSQEPETKPTNAFAQSAFANTAASSPFATLGSSTSTSTTEKPASISTSTSAFASSTLGSFAGSDSSPFGTLGSSKPSVFKTGSGMAGFGSSSTSGFGSLKSGFAGVGGGFAAAAKSGGLTNFASSNAPATLGSQAKPKAIGADESGDEGSDHEEGEETSAFEADKTDERFYEQTISTGEEDEETLFTCKGKLFHFSSGEWKERGVGTFKVNARKSEDGKQHGRMIMRADGALRVMLNSPVFKGMTFGDAKNQEPSSRQIFLASNEGGRTVPLLLRVGNEALAKDLYTIIKNLLDVSE